MKRENRELSVSEWMSRSAPVVSPETGVREALRLLRDGGIPALPVCDGGRFLGLVGEKELLKVTPSRATLLSRHEIPALLDRLTVRTVVKSPSATVARDASLRHAAEIMVKNSSEVLPVLADGRYVGLISWVELFHAAYGAGEPEKEGDADGVSPISTARTGAGDSRSVRS